MKKIFLLLTILLTVFTANAYVDCRDTINSCSIPQLVDLCLNSPIGDSDKVANCQSAVKKLQERLEGFANSGKFPENSCQKITNKMWLRTSRMTDAQTNGDVSRLQNFFKKIGIVTWDGDGEFGTWDKQAVWKFQQQYMPEISPTGDVGVKTMAKINSMICTAIDDFSHNASGEFITWNIQDIGVNEKKQRITAYFNNPKYKMMLKVGEFEVNDSCKISDSTLVKYQSGMLSQWISCRLYAHGGRDYAVFSDGNGVYSLRRLILTESGLNDSKWETINTVVPYAN